MHQAHRCISSLAVSVLGKIDVRVIRGSVAFGIVRVGHESDNVDSLNRLTKKLGEIITRFRFLVQVSQRVIDATTRLNTTSYRDPPARSDTILRHYSGFLHEAPSIQFSQAILRSAFKRFAFSINLYGLTKKRQYGVSQTAPMTGKKPAKSR